MNNRQNTRWGKPGEGSDTILRGHQINTMAEQAGYRTWLSRPEYAGHKLVEGHFECPTYSGGLWVHYCDITELTTVDSTTVLSPRLSFIVLLKGELRFALGDERFHLTSNTFDARGAAIILNRPTHLHRQLIAGTAVRKVHVTVTFEWLRQHCAEMLPLVESLAFAVTQELPQWNASPAMVEAGQAILAPTDRPEHLQKLFVENQALAIVGEGLAALEHLQERDDGNGRRHRQILAVRKYLDAHLTDPINLDEVGQLFGMSVSTLQRYFKQVVGATVGEYVRVQRLCAARQQLQRGASVSEAGFAAGYNHVTNFIAAYKKQFGCRPGSERLPGT